MQTREMAQKPACALVGVPTRMQRVRGAAAHREPKHRTARALARATTGLAARSLTPNGAPGAAVPSRRPPRGKPLRHRHGTWAAARAAMATVALVAASTTLLIARGATADRLIARGALEDAPNWAGPGDPQPPGSLFKVALTQKGYIQYLRYKVDVPDLYDFTYCLWLRSNNFTSPQPIFSYSRHETQRLVRGWLRATRRGVLVQMAVRERPVMRVVAGLREGRWHHVCQGWSAARARWALHLDGELVASGLFGHLRGRPVPGGGDLAVGQEVTDADLGLDDGIEGEVFGFNLAVGGGAGAGRRLARLGHAHCVAGRGSPSPGPGARLLVSWAGTPVGLYGGALVQAAQPVCGRF